MNKRYELTVSYKTDNLKSTDVVESYKYFDNADDAKMEYEKYVSVMLYNNDGIDIRAVTIEEIQ